MPSDTVSLALVLRCTRSPVPAPLEVTNVFFQLEYADCTEFEAPETLVSEHDPGFLFCGNANGPPVPRRTPELLPAAPAVLELPAVLVAPALLVVPPVA